VIIFEISFWQKDKIKIIKNFELALSYNNVGFSLKKSPAL